MRRPWETSLFRGKGCPSKLSPHFFIISGSYSVSMSSADWGGGVIFDAGEADVDYRHRDILQTRTAGVCHCVYAQVFLQFGYVIYVLKILMWLLLRSKTRK